MAAAAEAELKLGEKALATSLMKWKADYVEAEPHFQKAARGFKSAGLLTSAVAAWRRASDCSYRMGNLKQGAVTLEAAGREMSTAKDTAGKTEAARLFAEAAGLLQEAGEGVRAADLKLRAAKLVEGFDVDLAMRFVDECCSLFEGAEDKDVYAVDPLRKAMQQQLSLGKHASAMRTMDRLWKVWTRLDQKHNLYKLVLSRVILLLAAADPVAGQREYERCLDLPGFASAQEAIAAEELLQAYTDMDADAITALFTTHTIFGYLEPAVTRLARGLPAALTKGGGRVGVSKPEEAASEAVAHLGSAPPGADGLQFRAIGGSYGGGGSGGAGAEEGGEEDDASTLRAARKAEQDARARSSLFSRPGASAAGTVEGGDQDESGPLTATREAEEGDEDAFGAGAEDIDAAHGAAFKNEGVAGEVEDEFALM